MLGLSATYNYYLFNGSVDMRKGIFGLSEVVRQEMQSNPVDSNNVYLFFSKSRNIVKILHYERGFFVLYEKRPLHGKFKKPVFDEATRKYQISWSDMICFTEGLSISSIRMPKAV